jgi:hemin uptake protein HemP
MTTRPGNQPPAVSDPMAAPAPGSERTSRASAPRVVEARALLRGSRELLIRHGPCEYRLRLTRNDKLILTK